MLDATIVGLGRWGQNLVKSVQGKSDKLRFVSAVVRRPEAAADFARQHGIAQTTDFAAALADPKVQAIVLATPHSAHADHIVAATAAGKPIYCEKPLTLNRADAVRAVEACRKAGVLLAVGYDKRFWPSMQALTRVVASGELGDILHIEGHNSNESSRGSPAAWRTLPTETPGGGMTGTGVHMLDAFIGLIGPVRRVQSHWQRRQPPPAVVDTVSVLLEFENGVSGMLATVRSTPLFWRAHVFGTLGSAEAIGPTELVVRKTGAAPQRTVLDAADGLRGELEAFADAATGRAAYPITLAQMIDTVAAFEGIVQSLETGNAVPVSR
jgi:predicted dehydrogenase